MDVSAEVFEATIKGLRGDAAIKGTQRRISPRVGLKGNLKLWPVVREKGVKPLDVRARDVSATGIALLSASPIPEGSRHVFFLRYEKDSNREPLAFLCTARHCQQLPSSGFCTGFRFDDLESLKQKIDPFEVDRIRNEILK